MHVLVTGSSGFIGGYVVDRLIMDGHTTLCFDHNSGQKKFSPERSFFLGDIMDATAVTEAMAHCDSWIHLAGVLGTAEAIKNPLPATLTNVVGGLNVLSAATQYGAPGIVIGVGNHYENNTYSISKSTVERFADMSRRYNGTKVSTVRALNAYGPKQKPFFPHGTSRVRKIMPSFVCRALLGEPIEVYSDPEFGSNVMDMVYVEDVADVLTKALYVTVREDAGFTGVIEAGTGLRTTVDEIAQIVLDEVGDGSIVHLPMRIGETPGLPVVADTKTLAALGMNASNFVKLEDGVRKTVSWYKENWLPEYLARVQ